jgi:hypothetical protein
MLLTMQAPPSAPPAAPPAFYSYPTVACPFGQYAYAWVMYDSGDEQVFGPGANQTSFETAKFGPYQYKHYNDLPPHVFWSVHDPHLQGGITAVQAVLGKSKTFVSMGVLNDDLNGSVSTLSSGISSVVLCTEHEDKMAKYEPYVPQPVLDTLKNISCGGFGYQSICKLMYKDDDSESAIVATIMSLLKRKGLGIYGKDDH